jgi:SAM-dependent methyltransferase
LQKLFKRAAGEHITADLRPNKSDRVIDITQIAFPDARFDCVICSHVLEHVDDAKALAEIYRVLRTGGFAVLMVPIIEGWSKTYENPAVLNAEERTLHFGQCDHLRYYGKDFRDRVIAAGFQLQEFTAEEPFVSRYGLVRGEKVFVAHKMA